MIHAYVFDRLRLGSVFICNDCGLVNCFVAPRRSHCFRRLELKEMAQNHGQIIREAPLIAFSSVPRRFRTETSDCLSTRRMFQLKISLTPITVGKLFSSPSS